MWDELREWLCGEQNVSLPDDDSLFSELCSVGKKYDSRGRLLLEEKDEIKKRLGRSPDKADALALTFAAPVYETGMQTEIPDNSWESIFRTETGNSSNEW